MLSPGHGLRRLAAITLGSALALASPPALLNAAAAVPPTTGPLTINGGSFQSPLYAEVFPLSGTAPVGHTVALHFHKAGTPVGDYSVVRTVVADGTGFWLRPILANVAYRYYATDGGLTSATVLNAPTPTVDGPLTAIAPLGASYPLTGRGTPGSVVYLHFHAAGTAPTDYSIVRPVKVDSDGAWSRPYLITQDYRLFASLDASSDSDYLRHLVQGR